jgi:hypothetical protein
LELVCTATPSHLIVALPSDYFVVYAISISFARSEVPVTLLIKV